MPRIPGPRIAPTDDWEQLQLLMQWPEQLAYELLRLFSVLLHGSCGRAPVMMLLANSLWVVSRRGIWLTMRVIGLLMRVSQQFASNILSCDQVQPSGQRVECIAQRRPCPGRLCR